MLPSSDSRGLGLRDLFFSGAPVGSLALRPRDSLTIPRMALSIGFSSFGFPPVCNPCYGARYVHYPSSDGVPFTVRYDYDGPNVQGVFDATDGASRMIWQLDAADQGYRIGTESFGLTGASTTYQYQPTTGLIDTMVTTAGGQPVQALDYAYYPNGALRQMAVLRENAFLGRLQLTCGRPGTNRWLTSSPFHPGRRQDGVPAGTDVVKPDSLRASLGCNHRSLRDDPDLPTRHAGSRGSARPEQVAPRRSPFPSEGSSTPDKDQGSRAMPATAWPGCSTPRTPRTRPGCV